MSINKLKNKLRYVLVYLISFVINYLFFILFMYFFNKNNLYIMYIINFISWIVSMLFIFYVDKKYVPDLVDENNSSELIKFILLRFIGLILECLILFIFVTFLGYNYIIIKIFGLIFLFILNEFYVKKFKYKQ